MNAKEQAANAIKWIDNLPSRKQALWGDRCKMGDAHDGFCCLGAGCDILGIPFQKYQSGSRDLSVSVGLMDNGGLFMSGGSEFYGANSLTELNDETKAGFKRIQRLLQTHPHWVFNQGVADIVSAHYSSPNPS
jgi:hypothetical protein